MAMGGSITITESREEKTEERRLSARDGQGEIKGCLADYCAISFNLLSLFTDLILMASADSRAAGAPEN